jgi:hypothetical protein
VDNIRPTDEDMAVDLAALLAGCESGVEADADEPPFLRALSRPPGRGCIAACRRALYAEEENRQLWQMLRDAEAALRRAAAVRG